MSLKLAAYIGLIFYSLETNPKPFLTQSILMVKIHHLEGRMCEFKEGHEALTIQDYECL